MAFLDQIEEIGALGRDCFDVIVRDEDRRFDLESTIANAPQSTAVYCCGPVRLLLALERICRAEAGAHCSLHLERFGRPTLAGGSELSTQSSAADLTSPTECDPNGAFKVRLERPGVTLQVPADK